MRKLILALGTGVVLVLPAAYLVAYLDREAAASALLFGYAAFAILLIITTVLVVIDGKRAVPASGVQDVAHPRYRLALIVLGVCILFFLWLFITF